MFKTIFLSALLSLSYVGNVYATDEDFAIACVDNDTDWKVKPIIDLLTSENGHIKVDLLEAGSVSKIKLSDGKIYEYTFAVENNAPDSRINDSKIKVKSTTHDANGNEMQKAVEIYTNKIITMEVYEMVYVSWWEAANWSDEIKQAQYEELIKKNSFPLMNATKRCVLVDLNEWSEK